MVAAALRGVIGSMRREITELCTAGKTVAMIETVCVDACGFDQPSVFTSSRDTNFELFIRCNQKWLRYADPDEEELKSSSSECGKGA